MKIKSTLVVLCLVYAQALLAQAGTPDPSFGGGDGRVRTLVGNIRSEGYGMTIQPDGKIIVVGNYARITARNTDFAIVRYDKDGSLDSSFSGNGKAGVDFGFTDGAYAVALQPDGKIVVAGYSQDSTNANGTFMAVARLNPGGTLDSSFGTNGTLILSSLGEAVAQGIAIESNGKIMVGGYGFGTPFVLTRLLPNGTIDNQFGNQGKVGTNFGSGAYSGGAYSLAMQANGKIVMTGSFLANNNITYIAMARYNIDGTLDASFSGNGKVLTTVGTQGEANGDAVCIDPNGKIVVAGYYTVSQGYRVAVVRYNSNGNLDNSFGGNGKVSIDFTGATYQRANAVVVQPNGKVVIAGTVMNNDYDFALARLHDDGSLDNSFSGNGKSVIGFGYEEDAHAIALQTNGRILVAGTSGNRILLVRYLASGTAPTAVTPLSNNVPGETSEENLLPALYPNPADGLVTVAGLNEQTISSMTITDVMGRTCRQYQSLFSSSSVVNVSGLSPGVYFMEIRDNKNRHLIKFVKK